MVIDDVFKDDVAIICRSKEESDELRVLMSAHNINWGSGKNILQSDVWNISARPYIIYNFRKRLDRLVVYYGYTETLCKRCGITYFEFSEINAPKRVCDSSLIMEFYT